jgi:hypothetical protein
MLMTEAETGPLISDELKEHERHGEEQRFRCFLTIATCTYEADAVDQTVSPASKA